MSRYKYLILPVVWLLVCLPFFLLGEVNDDSVHRSNQAVGFDFFSSNFFVTIFSEPFALFIGVVLRELGASSPENLQLALYCIIIYLVAIILGSKVIVFSCLLFYPPLYLLAFNIQPMMISLLLSYFALMGSKSAPQHGKFSIVNWLMWLMAIGFHWVSIIFLPIIFLRRRMLIPLAFFSLAVLLFGSNLYTSGALEGKLMSYQMAEYTATSVSHVRISVCLAIFFVGLNYVSRKNNWPLRHESLILLGLCLVTILTATFLGFKAGSRLAFVLDLFLVLAVLKFWIPTSVSGYKIVFRDRRVKDISPRLST